MKKFMTSLLILAATVVPCAQGALADTTTVEIRAYESPKGDVLLLPSTQKTSYKVIKEEFVRGGDTILFHDKSVVLPKVIEPGMLLAPDGVVLGTNAVLMDDGKIKIKTKDGKTIIKYDD